MKKGIKNFLRIMFAEFAQENCNNVNNEGGEKSLVTRKRDSSAKGRVVGTQSPREITRHNPQMTELRWRSNCEYDAA